MLDAELRSRVAHGAIRYIRGIGKEGAKEPDRGELQAEAQSVVVAATLVDQVQVLVVYGDEAGELLEARSAYVAAVVASLLVCKEAYGQRSAHGKCVS